MIQAPNLDDRRFQDLVDEAKRMVQRRCPEWTDHNVSDPGVTLIETFAYVVDQLIYRLNRFPEQQYFRYLEMMGVERLAPSAATVPVTFWLSAPLTEDLRIDSGVDVSTGSAHEGEPVVFRTERELRLAPVTGTEIATLAGDTGAISSHAEAIVRENPFPAFSDAPRPGDALLIGLDRAAAHHAIRLRFTIDEPSIGVDPVDPPLVWEALTDSGWQPCDADDETRAFTSDGDVTVHVPDGHLTAEFNEVDAAWLRCRVLDPDETGQLSISESPRLASVEVDTIGGTVSAVHGEDIAGEIVGVSDGTPGQSFPLEHAPVVRQEQPRRVETSDGEGEWVGWEEVDHFSESGEDDRHFVLNEFDGHIVFGPAVRDENGSIRQFGAVPESNSRIRIGPYRVGGGRHGNVGRNEITTPRSALPFVARVQNRVPATGGLDPESPENASQRGPLTLGTRDRAVTLADYEYLARAATGAVARAKAIEVGEDGLPASAGTGAGVQVMLIPAVGHFESSGFFRYPHLVPSDELVQAVTDYLEPRRLVGARVQVTRALYMRVSVDAHVRRRSDADPDALQLEIERALYRYLSPLTGGPDGSGWPFGRTVHAGELFGVVQGVPGVEYVQRIDLFPLDVDREAERLPARDSVEMPGNATVYSRGHGVFFVDEDD